MEDFENSDTLRFCPACGATPLQWPCAKQLVCENCGFSMFLSVAAAMGAIIECDGNLLLTVRKKDPGRDMLDLPGGFCDPGETLAQTVTRELREELGIRVIRFSYICSFPNRYFYKGVLYNTLDMFVHVPMVIRPLVKPMDDVKDVVWVPVKEIDYDRIAFPSIRNGIRFFVSNYCCS